MKSMFSFVFVCAFAISASQFAIAATPDDQVRCFEAAMARNADAKEAATETMQIGSARCDRDRSSWESADRCYLIVARKFESALREAETVLTLDQAACQD